MNPRRVLAAAIVALLFGGGASAMAELRSVQRVTLADAVHRFRADYAAQSEPAAPTPTSATATATPATGPVIGTLASAPAPAAPAADVATAIAVPVTPAPGVYVYRTTGFEEIGIPGGRRSYPAETTMTVSPSACGADVRWDVFEERWDRWTTCSPDARIELRSFVTFHEFFGQVEERAYGCDAGTALRPVAGSITGRCADGDAVVELVATIVGTEAIDVGGVRIDAVHVRLDEVLSGPTAGTRSSDSWYRVADGLLMRRTAVTDVESETVFGHTSYDEQLTVELTSVEPLQ